MTFRIVRSDTAPPVVQCESCLEETRYWDDRAAARWKQAHSNGCPADPQTVLNARRNSRSRR